jgi:hypothetical protein
LSSVMATMRSLNLLVKSSNLPFSSSLAYSGCRACVRTTSVDHSRNLCKKRRFMAAHTKEHLALRGLLQEGGTSVCYASDISMSRAHIGMSDREVAVLVSLFSIHVSKLHRKGRCN